MSEFLKGNFQVKHEVVAPGADETVQTAAQRLSEEFRAKALSSIGGSMVYVDRTDLTWDGETERT